MSESKALYGDHPFPVAVADKTAGFDVAVPRLFYVWVFSRHVEQYVPMSVHNSKADGEEHLRQLRDYYRENQIDVSLSGAVLELSWTDFIETAVKSRLRELAEPLMALHAFHKDSQKE